MITEATIRRKLPVINGFVQIPDLQITKRTALTVEDVLTLIPGSRRIRVGNNRIIDQEWIELPEMDRFGDTSPATDYYQELRDAVE